MIVDKVKTQHVDKHGKPVYTGRNCRFEYRGSLIEGEVTDSYGDSISVYVDGYGRIDYLDPSTVEMELIY